MILGLFLCTSSFLLESGMLEIKISAVDMLKVLVHAGIDSTEDKAIIFDLLQYPERATQEAVEEKKITKRGPARKRKTDSEPTDEATQDEDSEWTERDDYDDVLGSDDNEVESTRIKKPRRINFKDFGGAAKPIAT